LFASSRNLNQNAAIYASFPPKKKGIQSKNANANSRSNKTNCAGRLYNPAKMPSAAAFVPTGQPEISA
jgi:hypothetical protein